MTTPSGENALPYRDTKPVGAADFYFAINATFRFIHRRFGIEGLHRYWTAMGHSYYANVSRSWKTGGLGAVAEYWRAFFDAEPGAEVDVSEQPDRVVLEVRRCPAIAHLRAHGREIVPCFCRHCYFVSDSTGRDAGIGVRIRGGNGTCTQTFLAARDAEPEQALADIEEAS